MANKSITILKLRNVLGYFTEGSNKKQISIITGVARNTHKGILLGSDHET
jgi:hypothetical protein